MGHAGLRRICFVTGTRAEFGLMRSVLRAIQEHPKLQLQIVVTGMHLHASHGRTIDAIRREGWKIDAVVPWQNTSDDSSNLASQTGLAISRLANAFDRLKSDIVLVTGDRVEVFAAASAAHISHRIVAHVHGGDRALGQIDDSLRHAITKLSHIHFPATAQSARRIQRLGEDSWRIFRVGSPGIDGIQSQATSPAKVSKMFPGLVKGKFAILLHHPVDSSADLEFSRANTILTAVLNSGVRQVVVIYPNNDPGAQGIIRYWRRRRAEVTYLLKDVARPMFLGLLRDAAMLVGNSSSGIIEAASFGTPVVDIGPRQQGRDRCQNVTNVPYGHKEIHLALKRTWNHGHPRRSRGGNIYGASGTGRRIATVLARLALNDRIRRKLIAY